MQQLTERLDDVGQVKAAAGRWLLVLAALLLSLGYAALTLFGSWNFLIDDSRAQQLSSASRAPVVAGVVGAESPPLTLPDDWREATEPARVWRYRLVFELAAPPRRAQEVYLPRIGDNARIVVNDRAQPHNGGLEGPVLLHWGQPLFFLVPAEHFVAGRNTLLVEVHANDRLSGGLPAVFVGERGAFDKHRFALVATSRALAFVMMGLCLFALFAFVVYAASFAGRFYLACIGICVSMVAFLVPHLAAVPMVSMAHTTGAAVLGYTGLLVSAFYLCGQYFWIDRRCRGVVYGACGVSALLQLGLLLGVAGDGRGAAALVYPGALLVVAVWLMALVLLRRYLKYGESAVAVLLLYAVFMAAMGARDFAVLSGWLPAYHGYFSFHGVALMLLCLAGLVALRIRSSYREQAYYQEAVKEVRLATRAASRAPEELWRERSLDQLVSRIATTYSHEFRNPLGAALATNLSMARQRWSPAASAAIYSMRRAIMQISEVLDRQFDFARAMHSGEGFAQRALPAWLGFLAEYPSCKLVWQTDPALVPADSQATVEAWLRPLLDAIESIPSVCMIHSQQSRVVLHLYVHLNAGDLVQGSAVGEALLRQLQPMSVREAHDGHYLYWRHAYP